MDEKIASNNPYDGRNHDVDDEEYDRLIEKQYQESKNFSMLRVKFDERFREKLKNFPPECLQDVLAYSHRSGLLPSMITLVTSPLQPPEPLQTLSKAVIAASLTHLSLATSGENVEFSWNGAALTAALSLAAYANPTDPSIVLAAVSSTTHSTGVPLYNVWRDWARKIESQEIKVELVQEKDEDDGGEAGQNHEKS